MTAPGCVGPISRAAPGAAGAGQAVNRQAVALFRRISPSTGCARWASSGRSRPAAAGHPRPGARAHPVVDEPLRRTVQRADLDSGFGVLAQRHDLARGGLVRVLGGQQAEQHRFDEHQGPEAAGVGERGPRRDSTAVGMPDQVERPAHSLEHGLKQGNLIGQGQPPPGRPRRAVPRAVKVGGQHLVAVRELSLEPAPLAAGTGARVQAHDVGSGLGPSLAAGSPAARDGGRMSPRAPRPWRIQRLRAVPVHRVLPGNGAC